MRVSTAGQKTDRQKDDLEAYAARAGLNITATYLDVKE
ncbi:MAG: recombinase family protein, partial [bacterium]